MKELMRLKKDIKFTLPESFGETTDIQESAKDIEEAHEGETEEDGEADCLGRVPTTDDIDGMETRDEAESPKGDVQEDPEGAVFGLVCIVCHREADDGGGNQEGAEEIEEAEVAKFN